MSIEKKPLTLGDTDLILLFLGSFISIMIVSTGSCHYFEVLFDNKVAHKSGDSQVSSL